MQDFQFNGVVSADKSNAHRNGEIVRVTAWLVVGEWTEEDEKLEALRAVCQAEFGEAVLKRDERGLYLAINVTLCSPSGIVRTKRRVATLVHEYLRIDMMTQ